jgi:3-phytase
MASPTSTASNIPGQTVVSVNFAGQVILPTATDATFNDNSSQIGGLSGVAYDPGQNLYYFISDDRGDRTPTNVGTNPPPPNSNTPPRFYTGTINLSDGQLNSGDVIFTGVTLLRDPNGDTFAPFQLDPEDIVLTNRSTAFISSEGEVNINAGRISNPFVNEFDLATGQQVQALMVPAKFLPIIVDTNGNGIIDIGDTQTSGVRNNLAFESLTITPDQHYLFTATENALFQDGPIADAVTGSRSRIIQYNLTTGQPEQEFLYLVDPVAVAPTVPTDFNTNGLVDLLAIDNRGTFLALERSFTAGLTGTGNTIKIYQMTLQDATDISAIEALDSLSAPDLAAIRPVQKQLLLNLDDLKLTTGLDNIEGIELGPILPDGRQSIVLVSDNNFSGTQFTQILTLSADVVPTVAPIIETPANFNDPTLPFSERVDSDDPAIYLNAQDAGASLVITAVKNGGLQIYDLAGKLRQTVNPGNIRYNNVDVLYNFSLGGENVDLAIASDRNNDKLVIFKINANAIDGKYVTDITNSDIGTLFQALPFEPPYSASTRSAYGLTSYTSATGEAYVITSRRQTGDVGQYQLIDAGDGTITATRVREFTIPLPANSPVGTSPQTEGMVVDRELGYLYIAQEDVGIWKFLTDPQGGTTGVLIDRTKELGGSSIAADAEGLTIYYGADGTGYLLASSQGSSTFVAYARQGDNELLGRFAVGSNGAIDSVQESDGADVINVPLGPDFPFGLFITQDGRNLPEQLVEGENVNTNFKFVPWENIVSALPALTIDTQSYNPRQPQTLTDSRTFFGDAQDDIFLGGNGNNTFYAAEGNNQIITGNGRNTIYTGAGNDLIFAGNGGNTVYAAEGDNVITTGSGDDLIYAGSGNNVINTGNGNDTVYVGSGRDRFILNAGAGAVTIIGFNADDQISRGRTLMIDTALTVSVKGGDTLISAGSDLLATLKSVQLGNVAIG